MATPTNPPTPYFTRARIYTHRSDFGDCSATCGCGTKARTRSFSTAAAFGGEQCEGDFVDSDDCTGEQDCEAAAVFSLLMQPSCVACVSWTGEPDDATAGVCLSSDGDGACVAAAADGGSVCPVGFEVCGDADMFSDTCSSNGECKTCKLPL